MPRALRSFVLCFLALCPAAARAATLMVGPGQTYTTVQSAINAAANGDTVQVAPGTYYEHLLYNGKAIIVVSSAGAATTILDGSGTGTVAYLYSSLATQPAILDGFTIQHGYPGGVGGTSGYNYGGAVDLGGNAIARNNIITNNTSCGIDILDGNVTVQNNHIFTNQGANTAGGDCRVNGYGILAHDNRTIRTNINILNNLIESNYDGGISVYNLDASTTVNIAQNIIRNNGTSGSIVGGPGVSIGDFAAVNVVGNQISGNLGVGIYQFLNNALSFISNTIYGNSVQATQQYAYQGTEVNLGTVDTSAILSNNIIVGNNAKQPVVYCQTSSYFGAYNWDHNLVYNSTTHTASIPCSSTPSGNIFVDPQLRNPAAADFHLLSSSPAIDTGNNSAPLLTATDLDGTPRIQASLSSACIVDMGAYEFPGNGNSCSTTATLQSSLNPSTYGQSVTFTAQLASVKGVPAGSVQFSDGNTLMASQPVSSTGTATYSTGSLAVGSHTVSAVYVPTGVFSAASANLQQVVNGITSSVAIASSLNPSTVGQTVTFVSTVNFASGPPPGGNAGSITFSDGSNALATVVLVGSGQTFTASYATAALSAGSHAISAVLNPASGYAAGSANLSQIVNLRASSALLSVSPLTAVAGTPIALTATVSALGPPAGTPTGTVSFFVDGVAVGQPAPLQVNSLGAAAASLNATGLLAGVHQVTCIYSGDTTFAASVCKPVAVTLTAAPSTLTLASNANPALALSQLTFSLHLGTASQPLSGSAVALTFGTGSAMTAITDASGNASFPLIAPAPGVYSVIANFAGSASYLASQASLTQSVTILPTATTLNSSSPASVQGQPVTFTAAITTSPANGTVSFQEGSTLLATSAIAAGRASFTTSSLAPGTHILTAFYAGDSNHLPSASNPVTQVVAQSDFTLASTPGSLTIATGHHLTFAISATAFGGFADQLLLTSANLPGHLTLSPGAGSIAISAGSTAGTSIYLETDDVRGYFSQTQPPFGRLTVAALPCLLLLLGVRKRRRWGALLGLLAAATLLVSVTGCSGKYPASTTPGTYSLQIVATGKSTNIAHTLTIPITVTP